MKQIAFLILCSLIVINAKTQTKNVLFLGNSYTYVNDLPNMLEQIANSFGDSLVHDQNTPGGYTMQGHSTNATTLAKIAIGGWNHVVIQSQSQEPSFPPAQVASDVYPYAEIICDSIISADVCAEPLFFMTWGRKNGDAANCPLYPPICTYDGMQNRLRESYLEMGNDNDAAVSPIGAVWKQVRDSLPSLELYSPDESHPSVAGTYVASCTFYASIWRKSPVGSSFSSTLSASDAHAIQVLAERVVLDSLTTWGIGDNDVIADWTNTQLSGLNFEFVSMANNATEINWDFGDGNQGSGDTILHNYMSSGTFQVQMIASNGCMSDTLVQSVDVFTTALRKNKDLKYIDIFPNPAANTINVRSSINFCQVVVYDKLGKVFLESTVNNRTNLVLDVSKLSAGTYFIEISNACERAITKLIKLPFDL